jgi:hypothetical protein
MRKLSKDPWSLAIFMILSALLLAVHIFTPKHGPDPGTLLGALNFIVVLAGLWFLRKVLVALLDDVSAAVTLALIVLGTNYFQAATMHGVTAQVCLFTIYSLILWLNMRWHAVSSWRYSIPLGISLGAAILFYPLAGTILLVPVLWNIYDTGSLKNKWILFKVNVFQVGFSILCTLITIIPLWFFYDAFLKTFRYPGYADGALFIFGKYFWRLLFSVNDGWIAYTPVIILAFAGFWFLAAKNRNIFYGTFSFFFISILIMCSWSEYASDSYFGMYPMVAAGAVLAIPLGFLVQKATEKNIIVKIIAAAVFLFLILLNLFQTHQFNRGIIIPSRMTGQYWSAIFGRSSVAEMDRAKMDNYEPVADSLMKDTSAYRIRLVQLHNFEDGNVPYRDHLVTTPVRSGKMALKLDSLNRFSPNYREKISVVAKKAYTGIRASAWVYSTVPFEISPGFLIISCIHNRELYRYGKVPLASLHLKPGAWHQVSLDYLLPNESYPDDEVITYVWYTGKFEMYVDDIEVKLYDPKDRP